MEDPSLAGSDDRSLLSLLALVTGLHAPSAERTYTYSSKGATAQTGDAPRLNVRNTGSTRKKPTVEPMKDGQVTVVGLMKAAVEEDFPKSAKLFVKANVERSLPRSKVSGAPVLVDGEMRQMDILYYAKEWDELGITSPIDFVESLACEVRGHPKYEATQRLLNSLTAAGNAPMEDPIDNWFERYIRWSSGR